MPSKNTFQMLPVRRLLTEEVGEGLWLDPFANINKWATITNDLNPTFDTDYHLDALEFLRMFENESVDGILFDPPYSPRQVKECYNAVGIAKIGPEKTRNTFWAELKDEMARIVKPGGKVISFGWNSQGVGKSRGFMLSRLLLIAHGGNHNDTICTVDIKPD